VDQTLTSALADVRGVKVDEASVRAHVIRPSHIQDVVSSRGLEEGKAHILFPFPPSTIFPYVFDVDGFGKAIHAKLKDSVAGYVLQLRHHGKTIYTLQWNWAKRPWDGAEAWTPDVRMHVASCSKLITAMAMTKLLNDKQLSYDTSIVGFLPSYWAKGPHVNTITFRQLMTHTSGLGMAAKSDSDFEFMKNRVAAGGAATPAPYMYQNMNFGLCRILIATINGNIAPGTVFNLPFISNSNDLLWDLITISAYTRYVQDHVFAPAGVSGPTLDHPAGDALAYSFPVQAAGWNSGDLKSMIGGAGWHMSPDDMLKVMGTFRRKGTIMSVAAAQAMLDNGFGIDVAMATPLGTLYNKNGLWGNAGDQVEQSLAYFLPRDMELVVLANSPLGSPAEFFRDAVTNTYVDNIRPLLVLEPVSP
jgi:CubicO group peptidase (beta-lactamase class C family)